MSVAAAIALDAALALTDAMGDAASRDDWAALAALDAQRQALLTEACAHPAVTAAGLTLLRERNDALIDLVRAHRERLAGEWQDSRNSQRAMQDYQRIARDQGA